jgi:predicted metal-dependent peptidase
MTARPRSNTNNTTLKARAEAAAAALPPIPGADDPVLMALIGARVQLLFSHPFIGQMGMSLQLRDASDWCSTAATDGRYFYYNRQFIASLTKKEVIFLVAHEIYHCIFTHFLRRGHRDPKLWNMAADYVINKSLVDEKIGEMPDGGLIDDKFSAEMASEEVYEILKKNCVKIREPLDMHLDLGGGGDGDGDGEASSDGSGGVDITIYGNGDGPPKLTKEEIEDIKNSIRAQMVQAAQSLGAGKVPAGLRRMIDDLIAPKMNWKQMLDSHVRSSVSDDFTYERFNPMNPDDCMLPSLDVDDMIEIAAFVDMSGSIGKEDATAFASEIFGITETFRDYKVHLLCFDTKVYDYVMFTPSNIDEFANYPFTGGGGTAFECIWDWLKENDLDINRIIVFTDGRPNATWGNPNGPQTLFIIKGNPKVTAPFGQTVHYEKGV